MFWFYCRCFFDFFRHAIPDAILIYVEFPKLTWPGCTESKWSTSTNPPLAWMALSQVRRWQGLERFDTGTSDHPAPTPLRMWPHKPWQDWMQDRLSQDCWKMSVPGGFCNFNSQLPLLNFFTSITCWWHVVHIRPHHWSSLSSLSFSLEAVAMRLVWSTCLCIGTVGEVFPIQHTIPSRKFPFQKTAGSSSISIFQMLEHFNIF